MRREDRAVSEVLGYVLVFTLVLSTVGFISVGVLDALSARSNAESVNNAEAAFDVFADNVEDVYARDAPSRATEISLGSGSITTGENVTIEVQLVDSGGTNWPPSGTWKSWRYRPLIYESKTGARIVYELGAVFRIEANARPPDAVSSAADRASLRKRDPPFVFGGSASDEQVLLPIVHINSSTRRSLGGSTVLIRTGTQDTSLAAVKERDASGTYEKVKIRLTGTPRYLEWQRYFESRSSTTSCTTTPAQNRVTCTYNRLGGVGDHIEVVTVISHEIPITLEG